MARYDFLSVFLTGRSRVTVTWVNSLKSPMVRLGIVPEQSAAGPANLQAPRKWRKREEKAEKARKRGVSGVAEWR